MEAFPSWQTGRYNQQGNPSPSHLKREKMSRVELFFLFGFQGFHLKLEICTNGLFNVVFCSFFYIGAMLCTW